MNGSPTDLRIRKQPEPAPSDKAVTEERQFDKDDFDRAARRRLLSDIWSLMRFSYAWMFAFILMDGIVGFPFDVDTWVLVTLIAGITGSSAAYFWKKVIDHAVG